MKTGTFDPTLKAEIDNLQAKIDRYYDWLISPEARPLTAAYPDMYKWIMSRWYAEKWELVKRI